MYLSGKERCFPGDVIECLVKAFHSCSFSFHCEIQSQHPQNTQHSHNRQGHSRQCSEWERHVFDPLVDHQAPDSWPLRPALTVMRPTSVSGRVVFEMVLEIVLKPHNQPESPIQFTIHCWFSIFRRSNHFPFRKSRNRNNKSVHSISVWETVVQFLDNYRVY